VRGLDSRAPVRARPAAIDLVAVRVLAAARAVRPAAVPDALLRRRARRRLGGGEVRVAAPVEADLAVGAVLLLSADYRRPRQLRLERMFPWGYVLGRRVESPLGAGDVSALLPPRSHCPSMHWAPQQSWIVVHVSGP